ncbi:MAG TPA: hypothetical protein DGT23_16515 [Micromonosporaceae bacterium]|nr:hypothetical protein [Micromonosporaceae bacterium]
MAALGSVPRQRAGGQSELRRFRNDFYDCLTGRADGLFDVLDAVCSPVAVDGIAHLSLSDTARRGHGGLYAAVADGGIDAGLARDVLAAYRPGSWRPDFAVDTTTWPRNDAECSAGRGLYHHPSRQTNGKPMVAGWCYQWLAGLSPGADSWTAPLDIHRMPVGADRNLVAVQQVEALLPRLAGITRTPLFVFDAGYNIAVLTHELRGTNAQVLVRVRNDRTFYARPKDFKQCGWGGRPPVHGARFRCSKPETWPQPDSTYECHDRQYGDITITEWRRLHPSQSRYRDSPHRMKIIDGTVIRLTVAKLPGNRSGGPKVFWLWWSGPVGDIPEPDRIWRAYLRRFDIEHLFRFIKQTLGWTTPKIRTPGTSRPVDLAHRRRHDPTAPGPSPRRRPPPALATPTPTRKNDPRTRPRRFRPST